jgi:hypothetical protein
MSGRLHTLGRALYDPASALRGLARRLSAVETLLGREVVSGVRLPLGRRLSLWRHGFTSRSGALFGVGTGEYDDYLSDYRVELLDDLGGNWADVPANKLAGHLWFGAFADRLPPVYGVVHEGRVLREYPAITEPPGDTATGGTVSGDTTAGDGMEPAVGAGEWVASVLDATGALVLKPVYGFGGEDVHVCRSAGDGFVSLDGNREPRRAFVERIDALSATLVTGFVEQAEYADRLFPDATNTLRVLTLWDPATDAPFVAGAVQRIGTGQSAPVDNWSRGGLSAEVAADGTLSPAGRWDADAGRLRWHETHPDTGAQVAGARVPDWPAIREGVLDLAETVPALPRVGWDVVVTDEGFVLLELNAHAGIETLQIHRPHLADPRVRRCYEAYGVV